MNYDEAEKEVRAFFNTQWGNLTSISWPDLEFNKPNATWVRFNFAEDQGQQISVGAPGSNRFRHYGILTLQIFSVQGDSSKDARAKATRALEIFMGTKTQNGVKFYNVSARPVGNTDDGYYQINVTASFYYDEIT